MTVTRSISIVINVIYTGCISQYQLFGRASHNLTAFFVNCGSYVGSCNWHIQLWVLGETDEKLIYI